MIDSQEKNSDQHLKLDNKSNKDEKLKLMKQSSMRLDTLSIPLSNNADPNTPLTPAGETRDDSDKDISLLEAMTREAHEEVIEIFNKIDQDSNHEIEYNEFVTHCLTKDELTLPNVKSFFQLILPHDQNLKDINKNYINAEILSKYFIKCGKIYSEDEIVQMMNKVAMTFDSGNFNGSENISFDTFYQFMTSFIPQEE